MPLYLVDTSAWVLATRRSLHPVVKERLDALLSSDLVATCGLIELELLAGTVDERELAWLQTSLGGVHRLATVEADWAAAGRLAFELRRAGITVPFPDALLATLAIRYGAILLHVDRHFDRMVRHSPLQVESLVHVVTAPE